MARRRKTILTAEQKKQARKIRRELKKANVEATGTSTTAGSSTNEIKTPEQDDQFWKGVTARMKAERVLNDHRNRPYWLSIPINGTPPVSGFFPCTHFTRGGRVYYGFLFREHRDRVHKGWSTVHRARKELTGSGQIPIF